MQGRGSRPTLGHCDVALAFHIVEGELGGTDLRGLNFVLILYTPGSMSEGNWTSARYVDEGASPQQREALEKILSGTMGGPMARWGPLIANYMGTKYLPIQFRVEGKVHSFSVPGIADFAVEPVTASGQTDAMLLSNTSHPVNQDLYLAKAERGTYSDHGLDFDNTGKNGHFATFDWHWPE